MPSKVKFNNIEGEINFVPLGTYNDLIQAYVTAVSKIKGVVSLIQLGSFTTPGLSDIDIIVIVEDQNVPRFEDISIKKNLHDKVGYEVIAHDVFVYPESLAGYLDGLFYIDRKKILFGKDVITKLSKEQNLKLKSILSFEYAVHRLEALTALTALPKTNTRDLLLFISTLRHTLRLLAEFNLITIDRCEKEIDQIEDLRRKSVNTPLEDYKEDIQQWIIPAFELIFGGVNLLGNQLGYSSDGEVNIWVLNFNKLIYNYKDVESAKHKFEILDKRNKRYKGRILFEVFPQVVQKHVKRYKKLKLNELEDYSSLNAFELRFALANAHDRFLKENNFKKAKSYIILDENNYRFQNILKRIFLRVYATIAS